MPFEVAESQKNNNNLLASHGPVLQQSAQDHSMLFVDKHVLFDGISQLSKELPKNISQQDTQSIMGMLNVLQAKGSPQPKAAPYNNAMGVTSSAQPFKNIASASQTGCTSGFRRLKKSNS